ncbi:MAG: hypothetical protein OEL76_12230 [Siculibacillus sp.]|nr:hypothetical protein [Siculibacillus sp.]
MAEMIDTTNPAEPKLPATSTLDGRPSPYVGPGWNDLKGRIYWATREGPFRSEFWTSSFTSIAYGPDAPAHSYAADFVFNEIAVAVVVVDPAVPIAAEFARVWHSCILSDQDPMGHIRWQRELDRVEEALAVVVPTSIEGASAILDVVRLRTKGCSREELDETLLGNLGTALRAFSAA